MTVNRAEAEEILQKINQPDTVLLRFAITERTPIIIMNFINEEKVINLEEIGENLLTKKLIQSNTFEKVVKLEEDGELTSLPKKNLSHYKKMIL